jgi:four helix bundle protein
LFINDYKIIKLVDYNIIFLYYIYNRIFYAELNPLPGGAGVDESIDTIWLYRTKNEITNKELRMMNNEEPEKTKSFDLEDRLIDFSVSITEIVETIPHTRAGNHYAGQLIRSGTSPALNYGEAQSGESRRDFIHKLKIVLKELRETIICLKIIEKTSLFKFHKQIEYAIKENHELISIFVRSIETAQKNMEKHLRNS